MLDQLIRQDLTTVRAYLDTPTGDTQRYHPCNPQLRIVRREPDIISALSIYVDKYNSYRMRSNALAIKPNASEIDDNTKLAFGSGAGSPYLEYHFSYRATPAC
jgi:hypothetical protein